MVRTYGSGAAPAARGGFSFIEILIGIIILVVGLVPLMVAYTVSTRDTKVSISQVQAINHASNLLEALRAFGANEFKNLADFPKAMEQRRGGSNEWAVMSETEDSSGTGPEAPSTTTAVSRRQFEGATTPASATGNADKNFAEFKKTFFDAKKPIVPALENQFKRSFEILQREQGYLTLIVKVSWEEIDASSAKGANERVIELRTVVADPYIFIAHAAEEDGRTGNGNTSGSSSNSNGSTISPGLPGRGGLIR